MITIAEMDLSTVILYYFFSMRLMKQIHKAEYFQCCET